MELYDWDRRIFKAQKVLIVQRSNSGLLTIAKKQMKQQQLRGVVESLQSNVATTTIRTQPQCFKDFHCHEKL